MIDHGSASPTDAEIIAVSAHRVDRFGELFDRHGPLIHRYLARRLGPDTADDLLAEVFLAAFRRRDRYDPGRPDARPWLYGIAAHVVAQHRRLEARHWRTLAAIPAEPPAADPTGDADGRLWAGGARRSLAQGLAGLAATEREILLLLAFEQLTYDEIAVALGIPVGTVRSRISRARRKIRPQLAGFDTSMSPDHTIQELQIP